MKASGRGRLNTRILANKHPRTGEAVQGFRQVVLTPAESASVRGPLVEANRGDRESRQAAIQEAIEGTMEPLEEALWFDELWQGEPEEAEPPELSLQEQLEFFGLSD
jgi:hypothetical protein